MDTEVKNSKTEEIAEEIAETSPEGVDFEVLKEMAEAGIMYGHKKTRTVPKFKQYIFMTRNGIEIIDLAKTAKAIEKAAEFLNEQIKNKKTVLLVATQPAAWEAVQSMAKKFSLPMIKNKWIGGLITNFKVIYSRLEYYRKIGQGMEKGEYEKYTKKERTVINKNAERMGRMFEGLERLENTPDALFIIDTSLKNHMTAVKEARIKELPIVAIIDSDDNPELIDYPIPANDHSKNSIEWIINRIIMKVSEENS
ncbi:MAG: 30S ribosomal protein S2 [Candidatus Wolfebacteria bacterium]|nr:30S ribosomal protein S2 [Candidatus Wolfebacteria bacterium]